MKKLFFVITMAGMFAACDNAANNNDNDSKDSATEQNEVALDNTAMGDDSDFAVDAALGGLMEVKFGELAKTNASSQAVKDFGAMMVTDHTNANEELKALAQKKNITLPQALDDDKQRKYDEFAKKKGAEFDRDYMALMVEDHKEDIEDFKDQAQKGKDADLKAFAAGKIPVLEHHLAEAEKVKAALK